MADTILFHAAGACSRVTMTALEQIGLEFDVEPVNLRVGQQQSETYLKINPMGKVPALKMGGKVLTENAAILYYLNSLYPKAGLLPVEGKDISDNLGLQHLVWCSSTLHPMTRQVRMPMRFTTGDSEGVKEDGIAKYQPILKLLEERFSATRWWYGDMWSIVDVYLFWNVSTAVNGGMDVSAFPAVSEHAKRVRAWPAFMRMMEREKTAAESIGMELMPEPSF